MRPNLSRPGPRHPALIQLLRTADTLWHASRVLFARWNLSPSQFNVLNLLHGRPEGMTQIELSRQLLMHRSNLTGLVDRLEDRGLVRRNATPGDRRSYCVMLSGPGTALLQEILPVYYAAVEEVWGRLPVRQVHQLTAALAIVCANAERAAAQASE